MTTTEFDIEHFVNLRRQLRRAAIKITDCGHADLVEFGHLHGWVATDMERGNPQAIAYTAYDDWTYSVNLAAFRSQDQARSYVKMALSRHLKDTANTLIANIDKRVAEYRPDAGR